MPRDVFRFPHLEDKGEKGERGGVSYGFIYCEVLGGEEDLENLKILLSQNFVTNEKRKAGGRTADPGEC